MSIEFIIIISSILASAFFSGMEIAFISSNKLKIELNKKQGSIYAKVLSLNINNPSRFITSMLIGNNIALVIYGIYMAVILTPILNNINNDFLLLLIQTTISTLVILITAEFLPKTIFQARSNFFLKFFSIPATFINICLYPVVSIILLISKIILGKNKKNKNQVVFGKTDLDNFIKAHTKNVTKNEKIDTEIEFFQNALDFSDLKIRECMIPRTEIIASDIETSINEVKELFILTGHSKILIYKKTIDKVVGYIHLYDLFKNPKEVKKTVLPISFFPETMSASDLLSNFIKDKRNIAVVLDEFGGTAGMITIEDIIEEIFGEIEDEHDNQNWIEKQLNQNEYLFSARHEVDYLNKKYNLSLPENENYETIGGLIFYHHESIPRKNVEISIEKYTLKILSSSETHVNTIKLKYNH